MSFQTKAIVMVEADELSDITVLLRDIARRVKRGEANGYGNHCVGVYTFDVAANNGSLTYTNADFSAEIAKRDAKIADLEEMLKVSDKAVAATIMANR